MLTSNKEVRKLPYSLLEIASNNSRIKVIESPSPIMQIVGYALIFMVGGELRNIDAGGKTLKKWTVKRGNLVRRPFGTESA